MAGPSLLVTGFGPFPGMVRNPSADAARLVAADNRWSRLGVAARALVLPTTYAALEDQLAPALREGFDAVLMIGVAGRARTLRVERRAVARASVLLPDASGFRPNGPVPARAASPRRTKASVPKTLAVLRKVGLPSRPSQDAGRYLCNAAYFQALAEPAPVLFVHVPRPPRGTRPRRAARLRPVVPVRRLAVGLARVAAELLRQNRQTSR